MNNKKEVCLGMQKSRIAELEEILKERLRIRTDLAERIVRLVAENEQLREALKEATEWISVEDRLPEYEDALNPITRYLIKITSGSMSPKTIISIGWLKTKYRWNVESDWVNVTHWRPIDSPKAQELLKTE